jgi:CubicO group peptidase (beta-lactamase class C family)
MYFPSGSMRRSDRAVPGVTMTIVDAQGIRASTAVGIADLASGTGASSAMTCPWFSMTKIVTVTAGDAPGRTRNARHRRTVIAHVPAVSSLRPATDAARITPRHLMSHSAGIANPIPVSWIHRPEETGPQLEDLVGRLLAKHSKLRFTPGARSSYSNLGTLVLGAAMEHVASIPFKDLITREVLNPLGMSRRGSPRGGRATRDRLPPAMEPHAFPAPAVGHRGASRAMGRSSSLPLDGAPYGGLVGPVEDIQPFLRMHLRDGELDGVRILTPTSASAMREIATLGKRYDLGLGWFRPAKGHAEPPFVQHLGGGAGFWNMMRIYPTRGLGVA